jgi:hypothetical protein
MTADLREPESILNDPALHALIDLDQPAGLLMTAVLHFVADDAGPWALAARYAGALAPGSYLALSHITHEGLPPRLVEEGVQVYKQADGVHPRSRQQIERFFSGLELVPPYPGAQPAVTHIGLWGADAPELADSDGSHWWYGGVAHRP